MPSAVSRRRTTDGVGRRPAGAPTRSTVTLGAPAHGPIPSATPSATTSRCGPVAGSVAHQRRSVSTSGVNIRSGPAPSRIRGWALCGSHLAHSHSANASGAATTASRASAGLCHSTNCATTARASARAAAPSGSSQIVAVSCSESATGRSGTTVCAIRNRRNASAVTGSKPSGGPGFRRDQAGGQALGAATDANVSEVGIRGAALPEPSARDDGGPGLGIGVHGIRGRALSRGRLTHGAPHLVEVAEVVAAALVDGRRARCAAPAAAGGHHAERRDREHAAEQPRRGVAHAEHDDEAQRSRPASPAAASASARRPAPPSPARAAPGAPAHPQVAVAAPGWAARPRPCP